MRRDWLGGLVVGASIGFLLVYGPLVGILLAVAFAVGATVARSVPAVAGLMMGAGGLVLVVVLLANANCEGLSGSTPTGCTPPDLGIWISGGAALAISGVVLVIVTALRWRGPH